MARCTVVLGCSLLLAPRLPGSSLMSLMVSCPQSLATWENENKIYCTQTLLEGDGPKTYWTRELANGELILVRPLTPYPRLCPSGVARPGRSGRVKMLAESPWGQLRSQAVIVPGAERGWRRAAAATRPDGLVPVLTPRWPACPSS